MTLKDDLEILSNLPPAKKPMPEIIPRHAQVQVMRALTMAYRKHRLGDDSIGWEELEVVMSCALQEAMGDEGFCHWLDLLQIDDEK